MGIVCSIIGLSDGEEAAGTLVNIRRNIPIYHFTTGATNPVFIRDLGKESLF